MNENLTGKLYVSDTRLGNKLVHAELKIGSENSGKLVSKVRKEAKLLAEKLNIPYIINDGTPGIGCPVIASITGAHFVVIVTEPTVSGFHDMKRVQVLVEKFDIPWACIINKSDLNIEISAEIKQFLIDNKADLLAELPYDNVFTKAVTNGKTVVEYDKTGIIKLELINTWKKIKEII